MKSKSFYVYLIVNPISGQKCGKESKRHRGNKIILDQILCFLYRTKRGNVLFLAAEVVGCEAAEVKISFC